MELNLIDKSKAKIQVADQIFDCEYNEPLIYQVTNAYLAGARAGTKAQKSRSDVRGGGAKPWRQKGTGRARAGTSRSPIWRSGGVTFAARPRDYDQKVNRKVYRAAMRSILSELNRQGRLVVAETFNQATHKTKDLLATLNKYELGNVLIVAEAVDQNLFRAAKNIPHVNVIDTASIDPVSLISYEKVLITVPAVKLLEERLA